MGDLYRFYDIDGQLLYVGISLHAAKRASQHRRKAWWNDVARMDVIHHDVTDVELRRLESEAIYNSEPPHNGRRGRPPEGERIEVRIPTDQIEWLDRLADESGGSRASVLRELLLRHYQ